MILLKSIGELAGLKGHIVLAAGTFDGLHLGHQALIRSAMEKASACGGTAVVMTFDRHPASVVRPGSAPGLLTTNAIKVRLLERMGVPALLLLEFSPELAAIPAEAFIGMLCAASKPLSAICVGSQWSFGKGGTGSITLLETLGVRHGFSVEKIAPVEALGVPINSTRIRTAVAAGDFEQAAACLGRPFLLTGSVVSGAGLGSKIGFPTANLDVSGMQLPPDGVYAAKVHLGETLHAGVVNIGVRPTVDPASSKRVVEAHLFGLSENLVGRELSLEFVRFLRPEQKFADLEALKLQITQDCIRARSYCS